MAEVLASLKKIGGNGEQYTETVLWTNPDPTTTFNAQAVTLSESLSNYKYIGINFAYSTAYGTGDCESTILLSVEDFRKGGYNTGVRRNTASMVMVNTSNTARDRAVYYVNDTSVRFGACYQVASTSSDNTNVIPLEILGINELAHQTVGERYDLLPAKELTGVAPTFATKGRAKAVWIAFKRTGTSEMTIVTNVNPTTGEVEENGFYRSRQGSSVIDQPTGNSIIITDTSVALQNSVSSAAATYILAYTY